MRSFRVMVSDEMRRRVVFNSGEVYSETWVASADRLEDLLRALAADIPPPPWWRPWRRFRWESDLDYLFACAHYGWPDWYRVAIKLGMDRKILTSSALLVGAEIPDPSHRTYPYPKTPI